VVGEWKPGHDPRALRKTDNAHGADNTVADLATDAVIGQIAARFMNTPEVRLWHDQLLYKPGQGEGSGDRSGNMGWHQDHAYWRCTQPNLITAWVPFDDVTMDMGCLMVVPGSHQWGLLPPGDFLDTDLNAMVRRLAEAASRSVRAEPIVLEAGQVSFHHCLMIHGSGPNMSDRPRRSLALHLMPGYASYIPGPRGELHMNAILFKRAGGQAGDRFAGEDWPVLYRE
jgi:ectoine hydroxylase-related dioxygenase (phytanoyl-CoA dioxygenase family)